MNTEAKNKGGKIMNTARKIENQNFQLVKGNVNNNKRLDRFFAIILLTLGLLTTLVDGNLMIIILTVFISLPLVFSKKRFVQL